MCYLEFEVNSLSNLYLSLEWIWNLVLHCYVKGVPLPLACMQADVDFAAYLHIYRGTECWH